MLGTGCSRLDVSSCLLPPSQSWGPHSARLTQESPAPKPQGLDSAPKRHTYTIWAQGL